MVTAAAKGYVAPGYEAVREVFERHLQSGVEEHAQCCSYVKGVKVVDLYGTAPYPAAPHTVEYGPDSIQNVFSSTKVLTSVVVALLADRGCLRYDQLVADLW
jgi:hypothetical protein